MGRPASTAASWAGADAILRDETTFNHNLTSIMSGLPLLFGSPSGATIGGGIGESISVTARTTAALASFLSGGTNAGVTTAGFQPNGGGVGGGGAPASAPPGLSGDAIIFRYVKATHSDEDRCRTFKGFLLWRTPYRLGAMFDDDEIGTKKYEATYIQDVRFLPLDETSEETLLKENHFLHAEVEMEYTSALQHRTQDPV